MDSLDSVKIIEAQRDLYVAEFLSDNELGDEVIMTPVIAWRIEYINKVGQEETTTQPITMEETVCGEYFIYSKETEDWYCSGSLAGKGLVDLLTLFQERHKARYR
ncbi:MAG: hypothetical protein P8H39_09965 [Thalassotalea sp.]|nr:hypothetical protein [Thalassotalea sp.]